MKHLSLICASALILAGACSEPDPDVRPSGAEEAPVAVGFRLEAAIDTSASVEPMTRATAYVDWLRNKSMALILKKIESRWIVDDTQTIRLDPDSKEDELKLTGDLPPCSFGFEMRPGDYRIVLVVNHEAGTWNTALTPGTVVSDDNDPSIAPPPLLTYYVSNSNINKGYRMLTREVFVAVADFTVPKSGDLHGSGMPPVALDAERRVGKFRLLLKDKNTPQYTFNFQRTAHVFLGIFTSERPFAEGIDALGGMYYSGQGLYELPWCQSTLGDFHVADNGMSYQICHTSATVFSPFIFVDPAQGEQPIEISQIKILGASGGYIYKTDLKFSRTLAASRITGIVFQANDHVYDFSSQLTVGIDEATDEDGVPEDAARLFDPYFEWNAATD